MAGGTGGHILPALAVAKALQANGIEMHWLGTQKGLESQLIPPTHIPIHYIQVQGIRGKGIWGLLAAPFRMLRATWQAIRVIRQQKPAIVLGFGGFVSAPGGLAAWLLRKPLILQEQNAIAGMTNRCLSLLATQIFQAFPDTFPPQRQAVTCGNPVRADILALPAPNIRFQQRQDATPRLLILGGSQGAGIFNQLIPETLAALPSQLRPEIWHSTGKGAAEKVQALYEKFALTARVAEFIQDMPAAYTWADLVICRAGALTIAELAAAGIASILVPYPHAVDDHQTKNAQWLVNADAALLIKQDTLHVTLQSLLTQLLQDRPRLLTMANAARSLAMPESTQIIVERCLKLIG